MYLVSRQSHRSASSNRLTVASFSLTMVGKRAISVSGADLWNKLSPNITSAPSLSIFRQRLKTFLFRCSYRDLLICYFMIGSCKKEKDNICYSAPQVDLQCQRRGTQVHGAHQAASHIPALYLPSRSRYSFTDPERIEGWVRPGKGAKSYWPTVDKRPSSASWTRTYDLAAAGRTRLPL